MLPKNELAHKHREAVMEREGRKKEGWGGVRGVKESLKHPRSNPNINFFYSQHAKEKVCMGKGEAERRK